jgi:hypothetical protein
MNSINYYKKYSKYKEKYVQLKKQIAGMNDTPTHIKTKTPIIDKMDYLFPVYSDLEIEKARHLISDIEKPINGPDILTYSDTSLCSSVSAETFIKKGGIINGYSVEFNYRRSKQFYKKLDGEHDVHMMFRPDDIVFPGCSEGLNRSFIANLALQLLFNERRHRIASPLGFDSLAMPFTRILDFLYIDVPTPGDGFKKAFGFERLTRTDLALIGDQLINNENNFYESSVEERVTNMSRYSFINEVRQYFSDTICSYDYLKSKLNTNGRAIFIFHTKSALNNFVKYFVCKNTHVSDFSKIVLILIDIPELTLVNPQIYLKYLQFYTKIFHLQSDEKVDKEKSE